MTSWVLSSLNQTPELKKVEITDIEQNHIQVEIRSSSLNHRDLWIIEGKYPGIKLPVILGSDGAGFINGNEVIINPGLYWGSEESHQSEDFTILGMPKNGTFADFVSVPKEYIFEKPAHLDLNEAAALPLAGVTAFRALIVKCKPIKGQKVLITGIGGGVALFAFQYAIALGCEVYVTSGSEDKLKKAKELGASGGANYKNADWATQLGILAGGFDIIIDSAGGNSFASLVKLCNPGGKISFYGASLGKIENLNPQLIFWRQLSIFGSSMGSDQDFRYMLAFIDHYKIKPIIDSVFKFEELPKAIERMKNAAQFGKIVISKDKK